MVTGDGLCDITGATQHSPSNRRKSHAFNVLSVLGARERFCQHICGLLRSLAFCYHYLALLY